MEQKLILQIVSALAESVYYFNTYIKTNGNKKESSLEKCKDSSLDALRNFGYRSESQTKRTIMDLREEYIKCKEYADIPEDLQNALNTTINLCDKYLNDNTECNCSENCSCGDDCQCDDDCICKSHGCGEDRYMY
ncbi:MAG: hypothetical protein LUF90_05085 [Rikenellaceae bacterium]|nr:hypothetical protein [Rikenellaceae bacterium]